MNLQTSVNATSSNITSINETVNTKIANKKPIMVVENEAEFEQDDDSLYKKVYLNNNRNNSKFKSQLPKYNASETIKQTNANEAVGLSTTNKTIDTSINTLKESINNFKKKFSNTIKLDADSKSNNTTNSNKNESLINNETNNEINTDLLNKNQREEEEKEAKKENIYDNFIPIDDTNILSAENNNNKFDFIYLGSFFSLFYYIYINEINLLLC